MSDAERILWQHLRGKRSGWKKSREPLASDPFIVDFVCNGERVIVEVNGGQHSSGNAGRLHEAEPENDGTRILSFRREDALDNTAGVLEEIWEAVHGTPAFAGVTQSDCGRRTSSPSHRLRGEGRVRCQRKHGESHE